MNLYIKIGVILALIVSAFLYVSLRTDPGMIDVTQATPEATTEHVADTVTPHAEEVMQEVRQQEVIAEVVQEFDKAKHDKLEPYYVLLRRYMKADCSATQTIDADGDGVYREEQKCLPQKRINKHYLEEYSVKQLMIVVNGFNLEEAAIAAQLLGERRVVMSQEDKDKFSVNNYYELSVSLSGKPGPLIQLMNAGLLPNTDDMRKLKYQYMVLASIMGHPGYDAEYLDRRFTTYTGVYKMDPSVLQEAIEEARAKALKWKQVREQVAGSTSSRDALHTGGDV